jgi:hypothetical protein
MVNVPLYKNDTYKHRVSSSIFMRKETHYLSLWWSGGVWYCKKWAYMLSSMNNLVMIWGSMVLWEVSFEYVHFNEQAYIKNRKVYK